MSEMKTKFDSFSTIEEKQAEIGAAFSLIMEPKIELITLKDELQKTKTELASTKVEQIKNTSELREAKTEIADLKNHCNQLYQLMEHSSDIVFLYWLKRII